MDNVLGRPIVLLPLFSLFFVVIWRSVTRKSNLPKELPWVGKTSDGPFSEIQARIRSFANVRPWLAEGYARYSQQGKSYIFPDVSGVPEIIIPNNKLKWLLDHPENVSSVKHARYDILYGDYAFTDPYILDAPYHEHVVHRNMARRLTYLIPGTWDELSCAFDEMWGTKTDEWKEISVLDCMMRMIARASSRMFVGLPLCRDEDYLKNMSSFATDVITTISFMPFVPKLLAPVFGRLLSIPNYIHYRGTSKFTLPLIEQRFADMERKRSDPDFKWEEPDDYVTWHIRQAQAEGKTKELQPEMIAKFLMPISFAAIHTTTFTITMTLFDLLGSDPKKGFMEGLREEAERVYKAEGGVWTKVGLNKLVRADSAIRESMRKSNFTTRGMLRKIISPEGMHNKEEGWTAPYGSLVAVDVHDVHHDPDIYPDPDTFDAFRFSRPREEYEAQAESERDPDDFLKFKNLGMISTDEHFLPFGHGRHACPGRFFVNHELKMLLAYMVMNYDVPYLASRPKDRWFGQVVIPPMKDTIRVRRRKGTTKD